MDRVRVGLGPSHCWTMYIVVVIVVVIEAQRLRHASVFDSYLTVIQSLFDVFLKVNRRLFHGCFTVM